MRRASRQSRPNRHHAWHCAVGFTALSLRTFAWLLTLHPTAAGRTYAAYGGVYGTVALAWLSLVEGIRPSRWDLVESIVTLIGMAIIMLAPRQ